MKPEFMRQMECAWLYDSESLQTPAHAGSSLADFSTLKKQHVPPKRRFLQDVHGATYQEMTFFMVTGVKTSNLT
jgi:hypothetical protein